MTGTQFGPSLTPVNHALNQSMSERWGVGAVAGTVSTLFRPVLNFPPPASFSCELTIFPVGDAS